ncbi:MAG: two pore domain potassium channel family protein [Gammaproteobacteria bacterium]|nr:two pore domain potassium channel family protein [Gammaproteobacteria bacterium]
MVSHMLEIGLFALVYGLMALNPAFGEIAAIESNYDYLYYSSIVYTTVGFGDLYPIGPVRMVTAIESLIGLVLITWSATFIYIHRPSNAKD